MWFNTADHRIQVAAKQSVVVLIKWSGSNLLPSFCEQPSALGPTIHCGYSFELAKEMTFVLLYFITVAVSGKLNDNALHFLLLLHKSEIPYLPVH